MTATATNPQQASRRPLLRRREAVAGIIFVLPATLLFLVWRVLPVLGGFIISLGDFKISGKFDFLGLDNFERMANSGAFWQSFFTTVIYTVIVVPLLMAVSISLALLVRRAGPFIKFFRGAFFIPSITSLVLAGAVFVWVFNSGGIVPTVWSLFGGDERSWLAKPGFALVAVILVAVWGRFGFDLLIVLARLQDLPREVDEAARVDGVNGWQHFWFITFPQLRPILLFLLVIETTFSFQVFDVVYVMTGGGPSGSTKVLGLLLYDEAFRLFHFGYAAAIGVAMAILLVALALLQRAVLDKGD